MRFFKPDEYYVSVLDIDPAILVDRGIKAVLLDLDNTILPRTLDYVPENLAIWVRSLKAAGLKVSFLSNDWHARVVKAANRLEIPFIGKAVKPLPHGFFIALRKLGVKPSETIIIGDQTFTDILGAHLCGMKAILVTPLVTKDLWHTRLLRHLDRFFLRGMSPVGEQPAVYEDEDEQKLQ